MMRCHRKAVLSLPCVEHNSCAIESVVVACFRVLAGSAPDSGAYSGLHLTEHGLFYHAQIYGGRD